MEKNIQTIIENYLKDLELSGVNLTNNRSAIGIFRKYTVDENLDFLKLTIPQAQDYQTYLSTKTNEQGQTHYSRVTVSTLIDKVRRFYDHLKKRKLIHSNPFKEISRVKRVKSLPRNVLTEENMEKLLRVLKEFHKRDNLFDRRKIYRAHVIAELMYSTGARINEVSKLKVSDIDFSRNTVRVHDDKTNKERDCILSEYASKVIRIYVDEMKEYVIFGKNGGDINLLFGSKGHLVIWINEILNNECAALELGRFTSHCFRHSLGFHLLRAGCDIRYVKEILGHENISTTQIYTRVDKLDLKRIVDEYHPRSHGRATSEACDQPRRVTGRDEQGADMDVERAEKHGRAADEIRDQARKVKLA